MTNRRATFAKRQREADLKEKARAKMARRMAKRNEVREFKGPEMGEAVQLGDSGDDAPVVIPPGSSPVVPPVTAPVVPPAAAEVASSADPPKPTE
jgi:hypothetical protein